MSSSYMTESLIRGWLARFGLDITLISPDQHVHDPDYRITKGERFLFQGTMDRCSDFMTGVMLAGVIGSSAGILALPKLG